VVFLRVDLLLEALPSSVLLCASGSVLGLTEILAADLFGLAVFIFLPFLFPVFVLGWTFSYPGFFREIVLTIGTFPLSGSPRSLQSHS